MAALVVLAGVTLFAVGYTMTPMPTTPQDGVTDEGSAILYADGKTPIVRLGAHRESVPLERVPQHVRNAVLAAEDRGFYKESLGVSPRGLARAVFKTVIGGDTQGGSTITQQLARNYYKGLSQDRTLSRKIKEIFVSLKVGERLSKNKILEMYLNTVYFGRQANGIQAAARAYFHKDVSKLTVAEGALLAAMIQRPTYFKTRGNDEANRALRRRWNYVLDGMVEMGTLSEADRRKQTFPVTEREWTDAKQTNQTGFIKERVMDELRQIKGLPDDVENAGLRITTSLDPRWMSYARQAMAEAEVKRWPKNIGAGLIAVDPQNGEIKAFYGGDPKRSQVDTVFTPSAQVGSSFKPYVLATALKSGQSIKSTIDGHSPQCFDGAGESHPISSSCYAVKNDEGDPPMGVIDLVTATEKSVNTAYVKLGLKLGLARVARTAEEFGIPKRYLDPHRNAGGLSLGIANIPAVYQAAGYAAFANGGTAVTPHLITKVQVRTEDGTYRTLPLPWGKDKGERVLSQDQAAQATYAMRKVVTSGTATSARLSDGRQVAGKTGTTDKNAAAWFVGYIPQLSTAVTVFNKNGTKPITGIPGFRGNSIYGGTVPAKIWKSFMEKVIAGEDLPPKTFPEPTYSDTVAKAWDAPPPPSPSPTPTPSSPEPCPPDQGDGGLPDGRPCVPSPTPSPSTPTGPPDGQVPCDRFGMPLGCNPDIPPYEPPPRWWCDSHPQHPQCIGTEPRPRTRTRG
ncbi:UNVERIFIED_ORG: membrane peptidoglycan carboxypeptidase [Actinomadura viridilutea]|uniref:transglycosylase domain-containing protein n=1 Tax=Actinomadura rubrobrunea TaxID=115335 RepID=UPI0008327675|nr:transglycosylase domain-containing protein [Actinomadura rubrobrunea]